MHDIERAKYPIGQFLWPTTPLDEGARTAAIDALEKVPALYRSLAASLPESALDTPYRPEGWTIRQVVHHVPESHMNMYIRMKLALTEDSPTIRIYHEDRWARLADAAAPVGMSLDLLEALHRRWVTLLRTLTAADFRKTFVHPDYGTVALDHGMAMYVWHSDHHAAHIRQALALL